MAYPFWFSNSYFLHWNFDWKNCFVVFFLEWNEWKNLQFNFSSPNHSIERNFFKWDGEETKILHPELNFRSRILKFRLLLQKPRSFEASVSYIVIIFIIFIIIFIIMFLIILTIFLNNIFSSFLAAILLQKEYKNWKKDNSQKKYMQKQKKSWKNALKIVFFSLFEYPNLGHRFSVGQMVRIYPDFG